MPRNSASVSGLPGSRGLPVLRLPLGGVEEVSSALAAIQYAYTGQVAACGGVREALELCRQGQYLQLEGCAAVCIAAIGDQLTAGPCSGSHSNRSCRSPQAPALELFANSFLWPDPAQEPAFAAVLSAAKARLVAHFGDALAALNTPELRRQLLALPAEGVEALLEADDFGTDVEDSVLLLLATWVEANGGKTDAAAVERLCRLVRLVQLSPDFATVLLPALACARSTCAAQGAGGAVGAGGGGGGGGAGWFPITCAEAIHLVGCCTTGGKYAPKPKRRRMLQAAAAVCDLGAPWFSTRPRRQCLTAAAAAGGGGAGRCQQQQPASAYEWSWSVGQGELEEELRGLQPGGAINVAGALDSGLAAVSARGFEWGPYVGYDHGSDAAGLYLWCSLPAAYCLDGDSLGGPLAALAQIGARLEVEVEADRLRARSGSGPGSRDARPCAAVSYSFDASRYLNVGGGWGSHDALPLRQAAPAPAGAAAGGGAGAGATEGGASKRSKFTNVLSVYT
ncbi:hypothetical protein GPECTOR_5g73 [Gonium pectorale]|uniref:BACK domain-containing protein n=1 Tax=Gonium pectorale TaxID=33097 RepID=A0A150GX77_GONPE|nr:hypothetical protein GPECTOR_5g73 [Gonium pectorale]|eukprot:KXZ54419.1 hypothetical protein GPECTOR_5g73 [Gonium pectorale]